MLFFVTPRQSIQSFFPILQVIMDLEVHIICVSDRLKLLQIRNILFWVFLGLGSDQSYQVEVICSQSYIEEFVCAHKPGHIFQGFFAAQFYRVRVNVSFAGGWVQVWRHHFLGLALGLLLTLHGLDFDQGLFELLGLSFDVGCQNRKQVLVVSIDLLQGCLDSLANFRHFAVFQIRFLDINLVFLGCLLNLLRNNFFRLSWPHKV